jgi:PKD repeat protein
VPKQFKPLEWKGVDRAALYDSGGILPPGATLAINGTGRNEYVTTEAPGGVTVNVTVQGNVTTEKDLAESIATEVRNALLRKAQPQRR